MQFIVEAKGFAAALARLAPYARGATTIPVLTHILVRADAGGGLTLVATNLDQALTLRVPARVARAGAACLPAAALAAHASGMAGDITCELEDGKLRMRARRSRCALSTLPEYDFPSPEAITRGAARGAFELAPSELTDLLAPVLPTISPDPTRHYINGALLVDGRAGDDEAPVLRAVSTDGHRATMRDLPMPEGGTLPVYEEASIIVPREAVQALLAMAGRSELPMRIEIGEAGLSCAQGQALFVSKLIDGSFPDVYRVIPPIGEADTVVTCLKSELDEALALVSSIVPKKGVGVGMDVAPAGGGPLRDPGSGSGVGSAADGERQGRIVLSAVNPDLGRSQASVDAEVTGPPMQTGFVARYLREMLAAMPRDAASVTFRLRGMGDAARAAPTGRDDMTVVVMPFRVGHIVVEPDEAREEAA
jgi:DNA polymerase-3 subunit beta